MLLEKKVNKDYLLLGMSVLHSWIRCLECFLKIIYRLTLKKWQIRGEGKSILKQQQIKIQEGFRSHLGIIVDDTKQGPGNSNDGNTARRFFQNYELSSEITGLDINLVYRFYVILQVIGSGLKINVNKFKLYSLEAARLFAVTHCIKCLFIEQKLLTHVQYLWASYQRKLKKPAIRNIVDIGNIILEKCIELKQTETYLIIY